MVTVNDPDKRALEIYEMICATSEGRPFSGNSVEELLSAVESWRNSNIAIAALKKADAAVLLSFLRQSFEWFAALRIEVSHVRTCATLAEGIILALQRAPKPLEEMTGLHCLAEFRKCTSMARFHFPFLQFVSVLTREQMTDGMRHELRKLHAQFAPSPTGKIDPQSRGFGSALQN
jgi:hypothetical protein